MRRYTWIAGLLALTAGACARSVDPQEERSRLLEADRQWAQSTGDLALFMSYWTPDGTLYAPGMPAVRGTEAIRRVVGEMSSAPGFSLSWTADRAEVAASGDIGYTTGTYDLTSAGVRDTGKYLTVWRKQPEGTWKVAEDIFNSDRPPPGAPADDPGRSP